MAKQRIAGGSLFRLCGSSSRWGCCSTSVTHEKAASVGDRPLPGPGGARPCARPRAAVTGRPIGQRLGEGRRGARGRRLV
jgi:hypothetical protein